MKKQLTLAVLAASLLAGSALASEATQDTTHLKKGKHHHHHAAAPVAAAPAAEEAKTKFFAVEATYNFNNYKPTFSSYGTTSKSYKNTGSFALGAGYAVNENLKAGLMLGYVPKTNFTVNAAIPENSTAAPLTAANITANGTGAATALPQATTASAVINVTTTKLLFTGMYDFGDVMGAGVHPYVEAGLGTAYNKITTTTNIAAQAEITTGTAAAAVFATSASTTKKTWDIAYQVGLGVAYKTDGGPTVTLGYRFADNGKGSNAAGISQKRLQSNDIVLGLQIPF